MTEYKPFSEKILWWGYKHVSGTYQAKRYWGDSSQLDLQDAYESDFVEQVVRPFEADGRDDALNEMYRAIEKYGHLNRGYVEQAMMSSVISLKTSTKESV